VIEGDAVCQLLQILRLTAANSHSSVVVGERSLVVEHLAEGLDVAAIVAVVVSGSDE
jgi:hypothetical protein